MPQLNQNNTHFCILRLTQIELYSCNNAFLLSHDNARLKSDLLHVQRVCVGTNERTKL